MRHFALCLTTALAIVVPSTTLLAQENTDPAIAEAELRKKIADAEAAEHDAEKAKYEKEKAAAEAQFDFLPKSPAEGKTEFEKEGAALESEFLVSEALASAAGLIVDDIIKPKSPNSVLILEGSASQSTSRLAAFQVEAFGLKRSAARTLGLQQDICAQETFVAPAFAAGALISAVSDMLKTDVKIIGTKSELTSAQLVRAIIAIRPGLFRTGFFDAEGVNEENSVVQEFDCLDRYRSEIAARLASFTTDEQKKANASLIARLTANASSLDALTDRLTKAEKDTLPLLALLYTDAENYSEAEYVLRVWLDKGGGTTITRKNLWTTLGARSVAMTGGAIVSYLMIEKQTGEVKKAGFLKCSTNLTSLRGAHLANSKRGNCVKLVEKRIG